MTPHRRNPWTSFAHDLAKLGWEAQNVVAMRLNLLSRGGAVAHREAERMVSEKAVAFVEAQMAFARAGGDWHRGSADALRGYRRRVRANRRRLSSKP